MSKEKKSTAKPKARPKKEPEVITSLDNLSVKELLDMELSIPDMMIGGFDHPEQWEDWVEAIKKYAGKHFFKQGQLTSKTDHNIDALLIYLDKYPELFAEEYDEINRDMIKWSLVESMKKQRTLIDKIQEIEKKLGLSMHHEW